MLRGNEAKTPVLSKGKRSRPYNETHLDVTICLSLHEPFYRLFHFGGVRQQSKEHPVTH